MSELDLLEPTEATPQNADSVHTSRARSFRLPADILAAIERYLQTNESNISSVSDYVYAACVEKLNKQLRSAGKPQTFKYVPGEERRGRRPKVKEMP